MFPSCCSKPAADGGGGKRSSVAKLLLGVFVVYMLHTVWLLYGFLNTKPCDGGRGEPCITSYLSARPRLQVSSELLLLIRDTNKVYLCEIQLLHGAWLCLRYVGNNQFLIFGLVLILLFQYEEIMCLSGCYIMEEIPHLELW